MTENVKKYNKMESILQEISKDHISLPQKEIDRNNKILEQIINQVTAKMKTKNALFKSLYTRVFYGGSYYDGLRVGHPEEYDLDLLLQLPACMSVDLTIGNIQGFMHLKLNKMDEFMKLTGMEAKYNGLTKLLDKGGYMDTAAVRAWTQSVVTKAMNDFPGGIINTNMGTFKAKFSSSGPAFTLLINGTCQGEPVKMDIDLVPCFEFGEDKWPVGGYRKIPNTKKKTFFIVPKAPKGDMNIKGRYWRLSFQEQERELMNGYYNMKPALKLLKKLRDLNKHDVIASYFIKTVFLWEIEQKDEAFWRRPLGYIFMHMLQQYSKMIASPSGIPYYWNKKNNLIGSVPKSALDNVKNRLERIYKDIETKFEADPYVIAKYLLLPHEDISLRTKKLAV